MKDKVSEAMPKFFESWCSKFDDLFGREAQRQNFRHYLAGLLGDTERKNVWSIAESFVGGNYHSLHHFVHDAPWSAQAINDRRIEILQSCRQTSLKSGFDLIIDDSGHRKSGSGTAGVGRQYIGQIGKVDNGVVMVTSHAYDGTKGVPLDVQLYKHASSLENGKEDPAFQKKPEIALKLIQTCLDRGLTPGLVLLDAGYGNNAPLLKEVENKGLKYVAAINRTRNVYYQMSGDSRREKHRIEDVAKSLAPESFKPIELQLDKPRTVWVCAVEIYMPQMSGKRIVAVQINAATFAAASEVDYYITNEAKERASAEWIVRSYSRRNWVEVFYREAKGWLGITEYEVRDEQSMHRHWTLVFTAYSLIQYQHLTGGLRRWSTKPLETFHDALSAYKCAVEFLLVRWIGQFPEVFAAHRSSLTLVWG
jgi:SRSO17 transposase